MTLTWLYNRISFLWKIRVVFYLDRKISIKKRWEASETLWREYNANFSPTLRYAPIEAIVLKSWTMTQEELLLNGDVGD